MKKFIFFITLFSIFSCGKENILDPTNEQFNDNISLDLRTTELCIMTFNTQLLDAPDFPGGPQCEGAACNQRAENLCDFVLNADTHYDVVNFQEAFVDDARDVLIECMEDNNYTCIASDNGTLFKEGAGLVTCFSGNITLNNDFLVEFPVCDGGAFQGCDSDCFARKGFMLANITLQDGCDITTINTHLDAGSCSGAVTARNNQINFMNAVLNGFNIQNPIFISGDFNIDVSTNSQGQFNFLLNTLGATPTFALANTIPSPTATYMNNQGYTRILDYILAINLGNDISQVTYDDFGFDCHTNYCVKWRAGDRRGWRWVKECGFDSVADAEAFVIPKNKPYEILTQGTYCGCIYAAGNIPEDDQCPSTDHLPTGACMMVNCD